MKRISSMLAAGLLLSGCGGKPAQKGGGSDVPQAVQAGHRVDLGLDSTRKGQLSDQDLVEIRAQLHQSTMSNIRAQDAVAALKMEEQRAISSYSLAQVDQALMDLRDLEKKLLDRKAALEAKPVPGEGK